jgi:hypothetical protein
MLVFDPKSWRRHRPWAVVCVLASVATGSAYAIASIRASHLLGGDSAPGLLFGVLAGLLVFYEFFFVLRKWKRWKTVWNYSSAQVRLRRHIWLGLLCLPLVVLHSALFTRGSPLSLALLLVFLVVIASGVWGLTLQQWLPRRLLDLTGESIPSQIPALIDHLSREAELLVRATCGPPDERSTADATPGGDRAKPVGLAEKSVVVIRDARAGKSAGLLLEAPSEPIPGTAALRQFSEMSLEPFLREGPAGRTPWRSAARAALDFRELRLRIHPDAHAVVDLLEALCERRRQLAREEWLQFWLQSWLWVHLPLSVSLIILLVWHVGTVFIYW